MTDLLFLKLGGSLLTDKAGVEKTRPDVIRHVAAEIGQARAAVPALALLVGHGSGSFGHVAAAQYGTRQGVGTPDEWGGFAAVQAAAARLHRIVVEALLAAGVPALGLQPSASAVCENGRITYLGTASVAAGLAVGLVPVVFGDVAFDRALGGTIISTEEILTYLAMHLPDRPSWLLLAGETEGVFDAAGTVIPRITPDNFAAVASALGGSRGTDVTGGMAAKVESMLQLVQHAPQLQIRIFSGLVPGNLRRILQQPETAVGTLITQSVTLRPE